MAISTTAAKFRKTGDTLDYTAGANIAAGKIIVTNGCVCLAQNDIANGATGALKILHKGEVVVQRLVEGLAEDTVLADAEWVVDHVGVGKQDDGAWLGGFLQTLWLRLFLFLCRF